MVLVATNWVKTGLISTLRYFDVIKKIKLVGCPQIPWHS